MRARCKRSGGRLRQARRRCRRRIVGLAQSLGLRGGFSPSVDGTILPQHPYAPEPAPANAKSKQPAGVFVSWFAWEPPRFDGRIGAFHCVDICFWFRHRPDRGHVRQYQ
jgi:hypothetical protein